MSQNQDKVKTIYDLDLHGIMSISAYVEVMRVPGGWIYTLFNTRNDEAETSTFVPYNNEFQQDKL